MRPICEYDVVRVARLFRQTRSFEGTKSVARAPAVGDVVTVCHEYQPNDRGALVAVEMVDEDGNTVWVADFEEGELELMSEDAL